MVNSISRPPHDGLLLGDQSGRARVVRVGRVGHGFGSLRHPGVEISCEMLYRGPLSWRLSDFPPPFPWGKEISDYHRLTELVLQRRVDSSPAG